MHIRWNVALLGAGLAFAAIAAPALADEWNKETDFTFGAPVEVPGHVLTPGRYVFKLADSDANRDIVQIFSLDRKQNEHLVTTLLAIPDYLLQPPGKPAVTFEERLANNPEAVHSWFYPGDNYGWEFVYPKSNGWKRP
ncbi:MAG: hypothetical protein M1436_03595 [Acidobacteria bacterium]|nr:hypothetical protein [Acidobacteriota bacterium]